MMLVWLDPFQTPAVICHHSLIPTFLISFFHYFDVLVESFTLFITNVSTIFRKIVQMTMTKMRFYTHIGTKLSIVQALYVLTEKTCKNMEILCIQIADLVESLPFSSPHRLPNCDLCI